MSTESPSHHMKELAVPETQTVEPEGSDHFQRPKGISMKDRAMYTLPGLPDITAKDIQRYTKSNENLHETLPELIQIGFEQEDKQVGMTHIASFRPEAAQMIQYAPETSRAGLIQKGFDHHDFVVRQIAMRMIQYASETARVELIQQGLDDQSLDIRHLAIQMIQHAPETARAELIQKGFGDKDWSIRQDAAQMIQHAPETARHDLSEKVSQLIPQGLDDQS